jgi:pilus assembly protein CpaD
MNARLPLLLASAAALGACATITPEAPHEGAAVSSSADHHRITVAESGARLDIAVAPEDRALSGQARAQVQDFAGAYLRGGHGALILSAPSGGANSNAASLLAHQTRLALVEAGVPYAAVAGSTYDGSGAAAAPIVLTFTAYEAHAPECAPLYTQDLGHQMNNQPWESFGCATVANLASLVEDPHDLIAPRNSDPRDSGRRNTVFDAYRAGDVTHADRSNDERVTVSNAVE